MPYRLKLSNSTMAGCEWKSQDPLLAQTTKLIDSVGLQYIPESQRSRLLFQCMNGRASKERTRRQRAKTSFFYVLTVKCA